MCKDDCKNMKRTFEHITNKLMPVSKAGIEQLHEYGKIELIWIQSAKTYYTFADAILADCIGDRERELLRCQLLDAYTEKRMYTLHAQEAWGSFVMCMATVTKKRSDTLEFIWTAPQLRFRGLATTLLKLLKIKYVIKGGIAMSWSSIHGITVIHDLKLDFNEISLSEKYRNATHLFTEMCNSSEEEPQDSSDLSKSLTLKMWLLGEAMGIHDVAIYIVRIIFTLHVNIGFRCIEPSYYDAVYGVMSDTRLAKQAAKCEIASMVDATDDDIRMYGQFMRGVNHIVRNRTMMIARCYDYDDSDSDSGDDVSNEFSQMLMRERVKGFVEAEKIAKEHGLYFYRGRFASDRRVGTLIILADSGINRKCAIAYAYRAVHHECLFGDGCDDSGEGDFFTI